MEAHAIGLCRSEMSHSGKSVDRQAEKGSRIHSCRGGSARRDRISIARKLPWQTYILSEYRTLVRTSSPLLEKKAGSGVRRFGLPDRVPMASGGAGSSLGSRCFVPSTTCAIAEPTCVDVNQGVVGHAIQPMRKRLDLLCYGCWSHNTVKLCLSNSFDRSGAGEGIRTPDPNLGKVEVGFPRVIP